MVSASRFCATYPPLRVTSLPYIRSSHPCDNLRKWRATCDAAGVIGQLALYLTAPVSAFAPLVYRPSLEMRDVYWSRWSAALSDHWRRGPCPRAMRGASAVEGGLGIVLWSL